MSDPRLTRVVFTPDMLQRESVQAFSCGTESHEREITDWLLAPFETGGALDDMEKLGTKVFLYVIASGESVGVGSVGPWLVSWPKPSSDRVPGWCIPMLGVDHRHQRKGYGQEILEDLVGEATTTELRPVVFLSVRVGNPAIRLYERFGFRLHGKPRNDPAGHQLQRMVYPLPTASS